jgi:hypothetical protein
MTNLGEFKHNPSRGDKYLNNYASQYIPAPTWMIIEQINIHPKQALFIIND